MREREHPLPDRNSREDTIYQVGRRIRHSAATTRIAKTPFLARVRNDAIQAACIAMNANKAPPEHTAVQEGTKFALHELRDVPIMLALLREERFQISGNDAVERILFGIARPVDVFKSHRDANKDNDLHCAADENSGGSRLTNRICPGFSDFYGILGSLPVHRRPQGGRI